MNINKPNVEDRQNAFWQMVHKEADLLRRKGNDYTAGQGEEDAYNNFREIARLMEGCSFTPYTVAMVYTLKHVFSLLTFCKTGKQESGEGLEGRHMDLRNYGFILNELVPDHMNAFEDLSRLQTVHNYYLEEILRAGDASCIITNTTEPEAQQGPGHVEELIPPGDDVPDLTDSDFNEEWADKAENGCFTEVRNEFGEWENLAAYLRRWHDESELEKRVEKVRKEVEDRENSKYVLLGTLRQ